MSSSDAKQGKMKRKKWLPYLIRGILGSIIAATLTQQFIAPQKGSNFPIYLGFYFLMNGVLSFKLARSAPVKNRGEILATLASVVGGVGLVIVYPFSPYRDTLISTDLGRFVFGVVVMVIGLLQVRGAVHMTPEPVVKQAHLVFGFLEILLGIVVIVSPIGWAANAVAFVWTVLVAVYMFYVAYRIRSM